MSVTLTTGVVLEQVVQMKAYVRQVAQVVVEQLEQLTDLRDERDDLRDEIAGVHWDDSPEQLAKLAGMYPWLPGLVAEQLAWAARIDAEHGYTDCRSPETVKEAESEAEPIHQDVLLDELRSLTWLPTGRGQFA